MPTVFLFYSKARVDPRLNIPQNTGMFNPSGQSPVVITSSASFSPENIWVGSNLVMWQPSRVILRFPGYCNVAL